MPTCYLSVYRLISSINSMTYCAVACGVGAASAGGARARSIAVAGRALSAAVLIGTSVACGVGGHSEAWKQGYDHGHETRGVIRDGLPAHNACGAAAVVHGYDGAGMEDFRAGCLARVKELGY